MAEQKSKKRLLLYVLVALMFVAAAAGGVYFTDRLYFEPIREQKRMIANLKTIVERLTRDVRMAEVAVTAQTPQKTTFLFQEVDANEKPVGEAQTFTIDGDVAYFDTLVIKFEDKFLPLNDERLKAKEVSDELVSKSLIMFRRIFSEKQKPEDGFPIDMPGKTPLVYAGTSGPPTVLETQLWNEFWELASNPELAKSRGVRAAHGQAVYTKLMKNKYYVLERRVGGDLTIRVVDVPAVLRK